MFLQSLKFRYPVFILNLNYFIERTSWVGKYGPENTREIYLVSCLNFFFNFLRNNFFFFSQTPSDISMCDNCDKLETLFIAFITTQLQINVYICLPTGLNFLTIFISQKNSLRYLIMKSAAYYLHGSICVCVNNAYWLFISLVSDMAPFPLYK